MGKADYKLLLSCPSALSPSQVTVVFDRSYDRIPHPDIELENTISTIWEQRAQKNTSLYNGKKFRYGGYNFHSGGGANQDCHVCLHLGLTDYRTFVGTNLNPMWEKFIAPSEDDLIQCQHMSNPLGNGAIIETSDKKIVVLQRSYNVGEFPGHFVFPGGHPEPEEVGITSHQSTEHSIDSDINKKVSQEMFDSIIREVVEEIGVPATSVSNPLFIGISRRVLNVRPAAFFFIKCCLQSEEIQQLYCNAQDGYESTQVYTVPMETEASSIHLHPFTYILAGLRLAGELSQVEVENMLSKMPGCHQGGFALYKLMLEALNN